VTKELREAVRRPASFGQTARAVAWSFFGVRKASEHEQDVAKLNPLHVIVAGLIGAVVFVLVLVFLVQWVIASGVAAN
jgi:amino acid transporter